jgi:hypothetical protein
VRPRGRGRRRTGGWRGGQQRGAASNDPQSSDAGGDAIPQIGEGDGAQATRCGATERWGRDESGPGGSDWVREKMRESGRAATGC